MSEKSREKRKERVKKYLNWVRQVFVVKRCLDIEGNVGNTKELPCVIK